MADQITLGKAPVRIVLSDFDRSHAFLLREWRYSPPYELYSYPVKDDAEVEALLSAEPPCLAVLDEYRQLIGYRCFGAEARVAGGDYTEVALDMGGALRPDLVGRGLGRYVLSAALRYAAGKYHPPLFRTTVASFNHRARKTCEHVGYKLQRSFLRPSDGLSFDILLRPDSVDSLPSTPYNQAPNKPVQRNAGSRPSSSNSPASKTQSTHAPRG